MHFQFLWELNLYLQLLSVDALCLHIGDWILHSQLFFLDIKSKVVNWWSVLSVLDIQVLCLYFNTVHKFSLIFSWYYQSNNAWTTPPHLLNTCELKVNQKKSSDPILVLNWGHLANWDTFKNMPQVNPHYCIGPTGTCTSHTKSWRWVWIAQKTGLNGLCANAHLGSKITWWVLPNLSHIGTSPLFGFINTL